MIDKLCYFPETFTFSELRTVKRIRDAGRQSLAEDLLDGDARFSKVMLEHVGYDDNDENIYMYKHSKHLP